MALLSFNDTGSGPVVLFLHGFCESKVVWKSFEANLSSSYRIVVPELPGHGKSPLGTTELSIEFMAEKVHELLQSLRIDKCTLIGHSLGGYVALAFAEKYPKFINGLGMFHSSAFADTPEKVEGRNKTIAFLEKNGVEKFADTFVEPLFYLGNRVNNKEEIALMTKVTKATPQETIIATTKAMRDRKDRIHVLKASKVPVLFIVGKEDGPIPLEKSLEQCSLPPESIVHFLEKTGHMGMFEKEAETLGMVKAFMGLVNDRN